MSFMFNKATAFNHDLSKWNVEQVTDVQSMFYQASAFNQSLSEWNLAQVTDMQWMFYGASAFNGDVSKWNVGRVTNMNMMFRGATSFQQVLSGEAWVNSQASKGDMFADSSGGIANRIFFSPQ